MLAHRRWKVGLAWLVCHERNVLGCLGGKMTVDEEV